MSLGIPPQKETKILTILKSNAVTDLIIVERRRNIRIGSSGWRGIRISSALRAGLSPPARFCAACRESTTRLVLFSGLFQRDEIQRPIPYFYSRWCIFYLHITSVQGVKCSDRCKLSITTILIVWILIGCAQLLIKDPNTGVLNAHYSWKRVAMTLHNIIVGKQWLDFHGEIQVMNHTNGMSALLKFIPTPVFSRQVLRKVSYLLSLLFC